MKLLSFQHFRDTSILIIDFLILDLTSRIRSLNPKVKIRIRFNLISNDSFNSYDVVFLWLKDFLKMGFYYALVSFLDVNLALDLFNLSHDVCRIRFYVNWVNYRSSLRILIWDNKGIARLCCFAEERDFFYLW